MHDKVFANNEIRDITSSCSPWMMCGTTLVVSKGERVPIDA